MTLGECHGRGVIAGPVLLGDLFPVQRRRLAGEDLLLQEVAFGHGDVRAGPEEDHLVERLGQLLDERDISRPRQALQREAEDAPRLSLPRLLLLRERAVVVLDLDEDERELLHGHGEGEDDAFALGLGGSGRRARNLLARAREAGGDVGKGDLEVADELGQGVHVLAREDAKQLLQRRVLPVGRGALELAGEEPSFCVVAVGEIHLQRADDQGAVDADGAGLLGGELDADGELGHPDGGHDVHQRVVGAVGREQGVEVGQLQLHGLGGERPAPPLVVGDVGPDDRRRLQGHDVVGRLEVDVAPELQDVGAPGDVSRVQQLQLVQPYRGHHLVAGARRGALQLARDGNVLPVPEGDPDGCVAQRQGDALGEALLRGILAEQAREPDGVDGGLAGALKRSDLGEGLAEGMDVEGHDALVLEVPDLAQELQPPGRPLQPSVDGDMLPLGSEMELQFDVDLEARQGRALADGQRQLPGDDCLGQVAKDLCVVILHVGGAVAVVVLHRRREPVHDPVGDVLDRQAGRRLEEQGHVRLRDGQARLLADHGLVREFHVLGHLGGASRQGGGGGAHDPDVKHVRGVQVLLDEVGQRLDALALDRDDALKTEDGAVELGLHPRAASAQRVGVVAVVGGGLGRPDLDRDVGQEGNDPPGHAPEAESDGVAKVREGQGDHRLEVQSEEDGLEVEVVAAEVDLVGDGIAKLALEGVGGRAEREMRRVDDETIDIPRGRGCGYLGGGGLQALSEPQQPSDRPINYLEAFGRLQGDGRERDSVREELPREHVDLVHLDRHRRAFEDRHLILLRHQIADTTCLLRPLLLLLLRFLKLPENVSASSLAQVGYRVLLHGHKLVNNIAPAGLGFFFLFRAQGGGFHELEGDSHVGVALVLELGLTALRPGGFGVEELDVDPRHLLGAVLEGRRVSY
ncbi:hypothetical protein CTA1_11953 [Colletotrichum tanaceti]|uniref:Uncharacterized protein n=1 Tax=Colletotrichum tanaceti TaxID=1306861 RepID=A0A4U6XL02_9PEZI|nr:hypothetical protein CTA1_11953 [Colletotrichum tanaceti]